MQGSQTVLITLDWTMGVPIMETFTLVKKNFFLRNEL